jgi:hypothetical protein
MHGAELNGAQTFLAPGWKQFSVPGKFMYAMVLIPIGDKNISDRVHCYICGFIEWSSVGSARLVGRPQSHDQLSFPVEFAYTKVEIGTIRVVIGINVKTVGTSRFRYIFSPTREEVPLSIEDDQRVIAAGVHEYAILGIYGNRDRFLEPALFTMLRVTVPGPVIGKCLPICIGCLEPVMSSADSQCSNSSTFVSIDRSQMPFLPD